LRGSTKVYSHHVQKRRLFLTPAASVEVAILSLPAWTDHWLISVRAVAVSGLVNSEICAQPKHLESFQSKQSNTEPEGRDCAALYPPPETGESFAAAQAGRVITPSGGWMSNPCLRPAEFAQIPRLLHARLKQTPPTETLNSLLSNFTLAPPQTNDTPS
jgi:hypothetical protein